jgi:hypothetical protein
MFWSSYMPCADCGGAVERTATDAHTCDPQRRADFQMVAMQRELLAFDTEFREYLSGNEGRFETWLAAREVRRP